MITPMALGNYGDQSLQLGGYGQPSDGEEGQGAQALNISRKGDGSALEFKEFEFVPQSVLAVLDALEAIKWCYGWAGFELDEGIEQWVAIFRRYARKQADQMALVSSLYDAASWQLAMDMRSGIQFAEAARVIKKDSEWFREYIADFQPPRPYDNRGRDGGGAAASRNNTGAKCKTRPEQISWPIPAPMQRLSKRCWGNTKGNKTPTTGNGATPGPREGSYREEVSDSNKSACKQTRGGSPIARKKFWGTRSARAFPFWKLCADWPAHPGWKHTPLHKVWAGKPRRLRLQGPELGTARSTSRGRGKSR